MNYGINNLWWIYTQINYFTIYINIEKKNVLMDIAIFLKCNNQWSLNKYLNGWFFEYSFNVI